MIGIAADRLCNFPSPGDARRCVCAVVVCYAPDQHVLSQLLDGLTTQVGAVVIVDNAGQGVGAAELLVSNATVMLAQPHNIGLAAAQNLGLSWARAHDYTHVLLLDQDSVPAPGMVARLLRVLDSDARIGAVGPRFHDLREQIAAPFVRIGFPFNHKLRCGNDLLDAPLGVQDSARFARAQGRASGERGQGADDSWVNHETLLEPGKVVPCDFLIGSGMLIPLSVIDVVGEMDAGLFIDNVDLEWSFRARAAGFTLLGVCGARLQHRLGDARRHFPGWPRGVVVHAPLRLYYMMRNRVLLYRLPHTPRVWVVQDLPRVLVKLVLFGVLIGPRCKNLHCMLRGLWDGARGRKGPAPALVQARAAAR